MAAPTPRHAPDEHDLVEACWKPRPDAAEQRGAVERLRIHGERDCTITNGQNGTSQPTTIFVSNGEINLIVDRKLHGVARARDPQRRKRRNPM